MMSRDGTITGAGFVEPEWLEAVAGKLLFYPAAGGDTRPHVELFATAIRDFRFNDLFYSTRRDREAPAPPSFIRLSSDLAPSRVIRDQAIEGRGTGSAHYRHVEPSTLSERYLGPDGEITIRRRRGFGQYALNELPEQSIGVFVHRSDSAGEGGSNMWFLANRERSHPPLSRLWDKLSVRLADRAIVVSDGSLTAFSFLKRNGGESGEEKYHRGASGQERPFEWRCVGYMKDRPSTAIWGLTRT